jgi:hypothetical protein
MISEVVNALFITYVGSEYLLAESSGFARRKKKGLAYLLVAVASLNVFDRVTGAAGFLNKLLNGFLHLPKVGFAALVYVVALYFDCKKVAPALTAKVFLPLVGKAFLRVLPAYPFLAVVISFGFMIVINIFEALNLPLEYLNWPIYYGT